MNTNDYIELEVYDNEVYFHTTPMTILKDDIINFYETTTFHKTPCTGLITKHLRCKADISYDVLKEKLGFK